MLVFSYLTTAQQVTPCSKTLIDIFSKNIEDGSTSGNIVTISDHTQFPLLQR